MVCPHLGEGGAQRVIVGLAEAWARRRRRIALVTLFPEPPRLGLHPAVHLVSVHHQFLAGAGAAGEDEGERGATTVASTVVRRGPGALLQALPGGPRLRERLGYYVYFARMIPALRRVLRALPAPVIVAFVGETNLITLLAAAGLGRRVVISERNDPSRERLDRFWNGLRPLLYRRAYRVTANSRHALDWMRRYVPAHKLALVPNPLRLPEAAAEDAPAMGRDVLLAVGRLHRQKGHDVLLRAFAALPPRLAHWRLWIAGTGAEQDALKALAKRLGIAGRVCWLGFVDDVGDLYRRAALFVQPSRYEGMSNALLEAMGHGLPVIVTDSCPGALELVRNGQSGRVVASASPAALAVALVELIDAPDWCRALGAAARERVRPYRLGSVLAQWEDVLGLAPAAADADGGADARAGGRP